MRAFIAIEMPENVKQELTKIQKEIDKLALIKGKFTEFENLHLTLKFLGEISRSELEAVKERLGSIKFDPFEAELGELGVFSEDFIRIVWIGLNGKEMFEIQKQVDKMLEDIFPPENRFMAHVTLARPKFVEDKQVFINELKKISFEKMKFKVDNISLKESELTKQGAKYSDLLMVRGM
ncbi:RNA 2',3'-cyclic phosphodiesterase [Candidatus Pacearchaeota archaeon]|nr:RNA 2',3'-cyclic phosphodiesterase [Candidatus Pacearchaeota archaeon]